MTSAAELSKALDAAQRAASSLIAEKTKDEDYIRELVLKVNELTMKLRHKE
jgi:hypothetical protein